MATHALTSKDSLLWQLRFLGYLTPAVVGATLPFFMVKPILARRATRADSVQIPEEDQPVLCDPITVTGH